MTTTELIKILQDNEKGGISHKPRNISLCINGQYMPNARISLSSTGDGVCGPEIDLDIEGDWFEQPCEDCISRAEFMKRIKPYDTEDKMDRALYNFAYNIAISCPSVRPTEPTGHNCNEDYADCDQFVCSECGIELQDWHRVERDLDDGDISYHEYTFRFCPNCRARIAEREEKKWRLKKLSDS